MKQQSAIMDGKEGNIRRAKWIEPDGRLFGRSPVLIYFAPIFSIYMLVDKRKILASSIHYISTVLNVVGVICRVINGLVAVKLNQF